MQKSLADRMIALGLADAPTAVPGSAATAAPPPIKRNRPSATANSVDPGFVEPKWFPKLSFAMKRRKGVSMFGPRGSGKSSAIREAAKRCGAKTVTLQCYANMQADGLLGSWGADAGTTRFIDGPLAIAVRNGSWLLAEEANVIAPGLWSLLNTVTDDTLSDLALPSGESLPHNPKFRLALLFNEGYAGTRENNGALIDRLLPIYCDYMAPDAEARMLEGRTGAPTDACEAVVRLAGMIRADTSLRMDLSPRAMRDLLEMVGLDGFTWADAYEAAVLDRAGGVKIAGAQRAVLESFSAMLGLPGWAEFQIAEADDVSQANVESEPAA